MYSLSELTLYRASCLIFNFVTCFTMFVFIASENLKWFAVYSAKRMQIFHKRQGIQYSIFWDLSYNKNPIEWFDKQNIYVYRLHARCNTMSTHYPEFRPNLRKTSQKNSHWANYVVVLSQSECIKRVITHKHLGIIWGHFRALLQAVFVFLHGIDIYCS